MRNDHRIYRTFEEFEREELRRMELSSSVGDMVDSIFEEELDWSPSTSRRSLDLDDDEE